MATHEAAENRPPAGQSAPQRLLPKAGVGVAVVAVLAHLVGGGALMHLGLGAVLMQAGLGASLANLGLGGGALLLVLVAFMAIKMLLLFVFGATGVAGGTRVLARMSEAHSDITTGKVIRGACSYDRHVALLTLGRGRALRERTVALAHITPGERVLDVGCGTGEVPLRAKAQTGVTGSVAGIDPSPEMIAVAREKAAQAELDIDYRVAAVEALPFADATFDVVLSSMMMHHIPNELKLRAVAEIRRVLKAGGRLVVVDLKEPASRLGRLAPVWRLHREAGEHRLPDLAALLDEAGFATIECGEAGAGYLGYVRARAGR
jgi:ubiquinone/menaquinone biosynthesis C-methylase UbiE